PLRRRIRLGGTVTAVLGAAASRLAGGCLAWALLLPGVTGIEALRTAGGRPLALGHGCVLLGSLAREQTRTSVGRGHSCDDHARRDPALTSAPETHNPIRASRCLEPTFPPYRSHL